MRTILGVVKFVAVLAFSAIGIHLALPSGRAQEPPAWPPVPPAELALKDNVFDPGSPAMILEYDVDGVERKLSSSHYLRSHKSDTRSAARLSPQAARSLRGPRDALMHKTQALRSFTAILWQIFLPIWTRLL